MLINRPEQVMGDLHRGAYMSDFLSRMKSTAKADKKTVVLPEGEDQRTIDAAKIIVEEDLANLVILGDPEKIDVPGVTVIDPKNGPKHEEYAQKFAELRAKKGVTIEQARAQMNDATYYGTMMVKMGDADGLVSGSVNSTANTVRPALQVIKTKPGQKLVSGAFLMCFKDHVAVFSDCAINLNPDAGCLCLLLECSNDCNVTLILGIYSHTQINSVRIAGFR